mgnify:CR=1 FL=1
MILTLEPEQVKKLTFLAILILWNGREVWLPKSQIILTVGVSMVRILVPEWLVRAKGL